MLEGTFKSDDMFLILRICLLQFIENLDFLQASAIPVRRGQQKSFFLLKARI
jgi:hypothetical protein